MIENYQYNATAFISCSLRSEDKPFIEFVEKILIQHRIKPIGTVGKFSASPINPAELMRQNIPKADMVVIIATPRYVQKDLHSGKVSYGLPEMVHVETGMAYMSGKPVVVFVQEGTNVGSFLPNITQYITLNGSHLDLSNKWKVINSLLGNSHRIIKKLNERKSSKEIGNFFKVGLAVVGGITIFDSLFAENKPRKSKKKKK
jgi:hypothetical protein